MNQTEETEQYEIIDEPSNCNDNTEQIGQDWQNQIEHLTETNNIQTEQTLDNEHFTDEDMSGELTYNKLDKLIGVEFLYSEMQRFYIMENIKPFYEQPTEQQIQNLPGKGHQLKHFNLKSFIPVFGLVALNHQQQLETVPINEEKMQQLINWFSRLPDLICMCSNKQQWYRQIMTNLIQNYNKWNIPNYFNILAETAYCILKFQSKAIVQQLKTMFKDIVEHEVQVFIAEYHKQQTETK